MISEVYYKELNEEECDPVELAEFYFFYNLLGVSDGIDAAYEQHQLNQSHVKNSLIRAAIDNGDIHRHPKLDTMIFGVSGLKHRAIISVEY